ncbi:MAG: Lipoprotein LpqB, GerMN domain protein [Firmicutes bacterium]|nr:Lipoprotein LpqB, GerMN domain protein [Bacillota bacterium]
MLKSSKYLIMLLTVFVLFLTVGCDKENNQNDRKINSDNKVVTEKEKTANDTKTSVAEKSDTLKVYYANEDGTKLVSEVNIKKVPGEDKYMTVMKKLIAGTNEKGAVSMIPKGTKLRGIKVEKNIAYVDFSKELVKKFNGGSDGEIMLVGTIVNTLTEFPEIKAVQILVEGKQVDTIAGHMDTSEPFKRFNNI